MTCLGERIMGLKEFLKLKIIAVLKNWGHQILGASKVLSLKLWVSMLYNYCSWWLPGRPYYIEHIATNGPQLAS